MSSRNAFTTSYIYNEKAVLDIAARMGHLGYGIKANKGTQDFFQVTGMLKNVEFSNETERYLRKMLQEVKQKFNIEYEISLIFIGDTYPVITLITTGDPTDWTFSI